MSLIVVSESLHVDAVQRLSQAGDVVRLSACDEQSLVGAVVEADALVVRTYSQVTAAVIESARRLRVIGRAGVGLDNIDLPAAARRGVTVVHAPAAATRAVAEFTVGLMLALERHIVLGDAMLRRGRFDAARRELKSRELHGLTLGIVGMGRIGRTLGPICCNGLGMKVIYNDIVDVGPLGFPAVPVEKAELYAASDVVSLHVPLTRLTHHLIDAGALRAMQPSALLINTSRGAVVDNAALAEALDAEIIRGAAVDVFDLEPPPQDHPLLQCPRLLATPHIAARTHAAIEGAEAVVEDVIAVLEGRSPQYPADLAGSCL